MSLFPMTVLDLSIRAALWVTAIGFVAWVLRRRPAALHHLLWAAGLIALLLLPIGRLVLPRWDVLVLPSGGTQAVMNTASGYSEAPRDSAAGILGAAGMRTREPSRFGVPEANVAAVLFIAWGLGAVAVCRRWFRGWRQLSELARRCQSVAGGAVVDLVQEVARDLGLRREIYLLLAPVTESVSPMSWGWPRSTILLPAGAVGWPAPTLRAILVHEVAHLRRHDWLTQILALMACAAYWPHPFVWWAAGRLRKEGERACDDAVLSSGVQAPVYARFLLEEVRSMKEEKHAALTVANGMAHALEYRLASVLDRGHDCGGVTIRAAALVLGGLVLLGTALACARPVVARAGRHYADTERVSGPGVIVTLRDSRMKYSSLLGIPRDAYIVHDTAILATVNAVRAAGAKALAINRQRLTATSPITCVGTAVLVNGRRVEMPLEIRAIGDPRTMALCLGMPAGPLNPAQSRLTRLGMISLRRQARVTLPAAR